eukprot:Nk52_evm36s805 gene=Nk52_evmTU36s805
MAAQVAAVAEQCELAKSTGRLDLSGAGLVQVPAGVFLFLREHGEDITYISLKDNMITHLPERLCIAFPNVRMLDLGGNRLNDLPDWIVKLDKLEELCIENNPFRKTLPNVLLALNQLKRLKCSLDPALLNEEQLEFIRAKQ